jgi:large subunit ribosomal protein L28
MATCSRCQKAPQFGHNRPWSKKATNRRFNVNLQRTTVLQAGRKRRVLMCSRCLRTLARS